MGKTNDKKFQKLRTSKRLEFRYDSEFYTLEIRKEGILEYTFIWKDQEKIFGPFDRDQSELGLKIYKMISKKLERGKIKF